MLLGYDWIIIIVICSSFYYHSDCHPWFFWMFYDMCWILHPTTIVMIPTSITSMGSAFFVRTQGSMFANEAKMAAVCCFTQSLSMKGWLRSTSCHGPERRKRHSMTMHDFCWLSVSFLLAKERKHKPIQKLERKSEKTTGFWFTHNQSSTMRSLSPLAARCAKKRKEAIPSHSGPGNLRVLVFFERKER